LSEISADLKKGRPAYCLSSAESLTADFLLDWLKSSCSYPRRCVASLSCRPQVETQLKSACFYGWRLSRTVPARRAKIYVDVKIIGGRAYFRQFLWKLQNPISAPKCPITEPKIRIWSLLLSKISYHTHSLQNGGHPRLLARLPKSVQNPVGGGGGAWGGGKDKQASCPSYRIWRGEWEGGEREGGQNMSLY
jgi:hypothetical protein